MATIIVNSKWNNNITVYIKGNTVYKSDPGDAEVTTSYKTLAAAINAAADGDTISVSANTGTSYAMPSGTFSLSSENISYSGTRKEINIDDLRIQTAGTSTISGDLDLKIYSHGNATYSQVKTISKTVLTISGGASVDITATNNANTPLTNVATTYIDGGTLSVSSGTFKNENGTVNASNGSLVAADKFWAASNHTITLTGSTFSVGDYYSTYLGAIFNATDSIVNVDTITLTGTFSVLTGSTATIGDITLNSGTVRGTLNFVGSTATVTGTTSIGNQLNIQDGAEVTFMNLTNGGTINVTGGSLITPTAATNSGRLNLSTGSDASFYSFANSGTVSVAGSDISVTNALTNTGTITIDATSTFHAGSVTNAGGRFNMIADTTGAITVDGVFNNAGGTLTIDVSDVVLPESGSIVVTGFSVDQNDFGTITLTGTGAAGYIYDFDADGRVILEHAPAVIFVNRKWRDPSTPPPATATYHDVVYDLTAGVNAFDDIQDAINHASAGDVIYFYKTGSGKDFEFDLDDLVTVDRNLTFEAPTTASGAIEAVKIDALKVANGVTAKFQSGFFSMANFIDNDGTIDIEDTRFNADLVDNTGGTIVVGTESRLVADAIDNGVVQIRTDFVPGDHRGRWLVRPIEARIGSEVQVQFLTPWREIYGDGSGNPQKVVIVDEGKERYAALYNVEVGQRIHELTADGIDYFYVGEDEPAWASTLVDPERAVYYLTDQEEGLWLISDVFDLQDISVDSGTFWSATLYVDDDWAGKSSNEAFTFVEAGGKTVSAVYDPDEDPEKAVFAYSTFPDAFASIDASEHSGTEDHQGLVIQIKSGTYTNLNPDGSVIPGQSLDKNIEHDLLIQPDYYWNGTEYVYDSVDLTIGGPWKPQYTKANLVTFSHLDKLTIDDWEFGSNGSKASVVSFIDIDDLVINTRLKPMGGATARIINCTVESQKHFSITGGTLIIDGSTVRLTGNNSFGAISTENNIYGSGTVIVRNSSFILEGSSATGCVVNLKINAEFTIAGACTVSGVFTDLESSDSDTRITFDSAILDENTVITGGENDLGASLFFVGYNSLSGSSISQKGNKPMTIDSGSTLKMTDEANITVGGGVLVQNCGVISLDNSTINAGSFDNIGNMTLANGASITLADNATFTNNGTLTADVFSDGTIGITGSSISIVNNGLIYLDLRHTDFPDTEDLRLPLVDINGGTIVVIGGGGSIEIDEEHTYVRFNTPQTQTLYVNGKWADAEDYPKGKNVGSYTYFGYNAYQSNSGAGDQSRYLQFSDEYDEGGATSVVVYYGGYSYSALNLATATKAPDELTITTIQTPREDVEHNHDLVVMGDLNIGAGQTLALAGATISMSAGSNTALTNSGTLNIAPGEDAKITLDVVSMSEDRDVKIMVTDTLGNDPEYHTVFVPKHTNVVDVVSKRLVAGRDYSVTVSDTGKYSAAENRLYIRVANDDIARIMAQNGSDPNARFIFTDAEVVDGIATLAPLFTNIDTPVITGSIPGATMTAEMDSSGTLILHVTGEVATTTPITVSVSNESGRFEYVFVVQSGTYSAGSPLSLTASTKFGAAYYYIELEEAPQTIAADISSVADSFVDAHNITNGGTINIVSQVVDDNGTVNRAAALIFHVPVYESDRKVEVVVGGNTYEAFVVAGASSAEIASPDFRVGEIYTITSIDGVASGETVTACTLSTLTADGELTNSGVMTIIDSEFKAGEVTNDAAKSISMTNTKFIIGSTDEEVFTPGNITNNGAMTLDSDSTIVAGTVGNNGSLTVDATDFTGDKGMRKVIDLPGGSTTVTGNSVSIIGNSSTWIYYRNGYSDYYVVNTDQDVFYVDDSFDGEFGSNVGETKYFEFNAFNNFKQAVELETAAEIVLEGGSHDVEVTGDALISTTSDLLISGSGNTVNFNVHAASELERDVYLTAGGTATELTVAAGVVFDTTDADSRGDVLLNRAANSGTINLNGEINGKNDISLDGNVVMSSTGKLNAAGAVIFNPGRNSASAAVEITGDDSGDAQIQAETLEFASGTVTIADTGFSGGTFSFGDDLAESDRALVIDCSNSSWDISGELVSGESGYADSIALKSGSRLTVSGDADFGGLVTTTITGSTLAVESVDTTLTNRGTMVAATASTVSAVAFANKGSFSIDNSSAEIGTTFTNGGVVLVLDGLDASDTTATLTVEISNGVQTWNTSATLYRKDDTSSQISLVADFGSQTIPDGTYTVTVKRSGTPVKVYNDFDVVNASASLSDTTFAGNTVTNAAGADFAVTDSNFTAANLTNSGSFAITGSTVGLQVVTRSVSGGALINNSDFLVEDSVFETGTVFNYSASGVITVTNSQFTANEITNSMSASIVIEDSEFTASVSLTNNGTITVDGVDVLHITALTGSAIQALDGATLSDSDVDGTVEVVSGGTLTLDGANTITTLDLSNSDSLAVMNWQDTLTFSSFGSDYDGKFTMDMTGYDGTTKLILDSTDNSWSKAQYMDLLSDWGTSESSYKFKEINGDLYVHSRFAVANVTASGDDSTATPEHPDFKTTAAAVSVDPDQIIVKDGTYSVVPEFNGIKTTIQKDAGKNTRFTRGVFGGKMVDSPAGSMETPVDMNIDLTVTGGTFEKIVVGGSNIDLATNAEVYIVGGTTQEVNISNGLFKGMLTAGDRFTEGVFTRIGDIDMTITGGTFTYFVGGGMLNATTSTTAGNAIIDGDVSMTISGGNFTSNCWIYGGCVCTKKEKGYSTITKINGNVTVKVDASSNAINLCSIVVGSHGWGTISGDTRLTFTGSGANITFNADNGEIWGSSSGDHLNSATKKISKTDSSVSGDRVLEFAGFTGQLNCTKIRAFSKLELHNLESTNSTVTLNNTKFNLSGLEIWEFDCGSSLSGNFINDFTEDVLDFRGYSSGSYTLISDINASDSCDVFRNFGALTDICFDGTSAGELSYDSTNSCWTWGVPGASLGIVTEENTKNMVLTIA